MVHVILLLIKLPGPLYTLWYTMSDALGFGMLMQSGGPPVWNGSHFSGTLGSVAHGDFDINIMGMSKWNYPPTTGFHFVTTIDYALLCSMPRETSGFFKLMRIFSPDILLGIAFSFTCVVLLIYAIGKLSREENATLLSIRYLCLNLIHMHSSSSQFSGNVCNCSIQILARRME